MDIQYLKDILQRNQDVVIAIDGPSGSGKSTLASFLEERYDCLVFHTDDYFLDPSFKTTKRLQEPGGNVDYERMILEIFNHIQDTSIPSHHFNCQTNQLEVRPYFTKKPVIIIEGVYSMHPLFQPYIDYSIFMDIDRETQYDRILKRSNPKMLERFKNEWIPLEDLYFTSFDIKNTVDLVLKSSTNFREIF